MILLAVLYNLAMAAVDATGLFYVSRQRTALAWFAASVWSGIAAFVLAILLPIVFGRTLFAVVHLAAYGLFLHGSVVLLGSAFFLRRRRPKTAAGVLGVAVLVIVVAVDAFLVEPTWLEVSRVRLATPKIDRTVRIVVLADLQTDRFGAYEQEVLRRVMQEEPDLILLAGDYFQSGRTDRETLRGQLNNFLRNQRFSAPLGVFAVRGNVDPPGWAGIFQGLPITAVEATESFELAGLRLTCLSRRDSFDASLAVGPAAPGRFHLVLGHSPNFALGRIEADLLVAGHTHGGQVRLPLVGPLLTLSDVPRGWAAGETDLPGGSKLLVSRGIGMERGSAPRLRFLCRPKLVVIEVAPE